MRDARPLLWLLAVAAGVTVANLYYCQPLLAMMGAAFHASAHEIGLAAVFTQAGYAAAMLFIIPLGDSHERRRLMVLTAIASALALLVVGLAGSLWILLAGSFAIGLSTAVPQLSVPYAAGLVHSSERGSSVGKVMSGLLIGILLSRTVSGVVGERLGWRAIFLIGCAVMIGMALLLQALLPKQEPERRVPYAELLKSLPRLLRDEPVLLRHSVLGALAFASFSAFWTTLVFLLQSAQTAGLFGLVGVAGALAAPMAGKLADRHGARFVNGLALACVLAAWILFAVFWRSLIGLAAGVILLDLGVQSNHISNQTRVLGLSTTLRNRLNAVYMVLYFIGAAGGSFLGAYAFSASGWTGVNALGITLSLLALVAWRFLAAESGIVRRPAASKA
jgi:predicted MFS family arabinose efflux permease